MEWGNTAPLPSRPTSPPAPRQRPAFLLHMQVAVIPEGGGHPLALLGLVRLVHWLATAPGGAGLPCPHTTPYHIVTDAGTGTTAIGKSNLLNKSTLRIRYCILHIAYSWYYWHIAYAIGRIAK